MAWYDFFKKVGHTAGDLTADVVFGAGKALEGVVDFGAGVGGAVAGLFSDDAEKAVKGFIETDWVGKVATPVDEFFDQSITNDSKGGQIVESIFSGVGQMLPSVAIFLATGGVSAGTMLPQIASLSTLGVSAAGTNTEEAFNDGADYGEGMLYGAASGATEVATEMLFPGFTGIGGAVKGVGKNVGKEVAEQGVKRIAKNALDEGAEEMLSELTNPARKAIYKGTDAFKEYGEGEYWAGVGEAGIVGAGTGMLYGGTVGKAANAIKGQNADINASLEKVSELQEKRDAEFAEGDVSKREGYNESIDANYKQVEKVLKKQSPEKRAKYISTYGLDGVFSEDGSLKETIKSEASYDKRYYSATFDGSEDIIKNDIAVFNQNDGTSTDVYSDELTENGQKHFTKIKKMLNALNSKMSKKLSVVVLDDNASFKAALAGEGKNTIYIKASTIESDNWAEAPIHETGHFGENTEAHATLIELLQGDSSLVESAQNTVLGAKEYGFDYDELDGIIKKESRGETLTAEETKKLKSFDTETGVTMVGQALGNEAFVDKIIRSNESLAKRIVGKWQDIKESLKSRKSAESREEYKRIVQAQKLFLEAAERAGNPNLADYIRGYIEDEEEDAEFLRGTSEDVDNTRETSYNKRHSNELLNMLTGEEKSLFYQGISELDSQKYHKHKLPNGNYLLDVGNKLIETNGDYNSPTIESIIKFNQFSGQKSKARDYIYENINNGISIRESVGIVNALCQEEVINFYSRRGSGQNQAGYGQGLDYGQNRGTSQNGNNGTGVSRQTRGNKRRIISYHVNEDGSTETVYSDGTKVVENGAEYSRESSGDGLNGREALTMGERYSYDNLVAKPDMRVSVLGSYTPTTREGVISTAKKNALKFGFTDEKGLLHIPVKDIDGDVIVGTDGLKHGLRRSKNISENANAIVTAQVGEILSNSIKINELTPTKESASDSYVLIGGAVDPKNKILYIVRSVVNRYSDQLDYIDVLYAVNAKKELAAPNAPRYAKKLLSVTNPTISISNLLEYVNSYFPDILPMNVLKHFGHIERPKGQLGSSARYSRDSSSEGLNGKAPLSMTGRTATVDRTVLQRQNFKIYSRENAEQIISSIAFNVLTSDGDTVEVIKDKSTLADIIYKKLNAADPKDRYKVAQGIADEVIKHIALKAVYDSPKNQVHIKEMSAIRDYLHSFDLSHIMPDIEARYGEKQAKAIRMLWGARKGKNGLSADVVGQELSGGYGIKIEAISEADIFFEIYDMYVAAKDALSKRADNMLENVVGVEERQSLKKEITKEIMDGFRLLGKKSMLAKLLEKETAKAAIWKEKYFDQNRRHTAITHLFESIDKASRILKNDANSEIYDEVSYIARLLKKLKTNRGNLSKNAREIMARYAEKVGTTDTKLYELLYDKLEGENNPFAAEIEEIAHGKGELSTKELEALDSIIQNFIHNSNNYNRVFMDGKRQDAQALITQGVKETGETLASKDGWMVKVKESLQAPVWRFERLGGYRKNSVMVKLWQEFENAYNRQVTFEMTAALHFEQFFKDNKKLIDKWRDSNYELNGDKVSRGQMIYFYLASLREQGRGHLFGEVGHGVALFTNEKAALKRGVSAGESEGRDIQINDEDILAFEKTLTDTEREFIALTQEFFDVISKDAKAEVDMELYGVIKVLKDHYIPLRVADDQLYKRLGDGTFKFADMFNLYSPSFNKATVEKANNKLVIENIIDVINRHTHQMGVYYGFAQAVKTFNRVYNMNVKGVGSMRQAIRRVDSRFETYVGKFIQDIQGNRIPKNLIQRGVAKLRGLGAKAALGMNLKVLGTQFVSLPASAAIGVKYRNIGKGVISEVVNRKHNDEIMFKYCPMLWDRFRNGHNIDVGLLKDGRGIIGTLDAITELSTLGIGGIDAFVCRSIWYGALEQTKSGDYELYSDEHYTAAGKLAQKAVSRTQSNYATIYRSEILRSQDSFVQLTTMFMGEPLQQFSLLSSAIEKLRVSKHMLKNANEDTRAEFEALRKQAKSEAAHAISAIMIDTLILALIAELFSWIKDDDDEFKVEDVLSEIASNFVGMFPVVKDLYGYLMNGYEYTNMAYTGLTNIVDGFSWLWETVDLIYSGSAYDETQFRRKVRKVVLGVSQTFGIPLRNLETYTKGIWEKFSPSGAYKYESLFFGSMSQYSKDFEKAVADDDEKLADTILDIMLDEGTTDATLRAEMRALTLAGYKVFPRSIGDTITYDGMEIELTKKQKEQFKRIYAAGYQGAEALVKLKLYKETNGDAKYYSMRFIFDTYYNLALQEALGVDLESKNILFAEAIDIEQLAVIVGIARTIEADVDKKTGKPISGSRKAKIEKYVESLPLKAAQKHMIMGYLGYKNKNGEDKVKAYINTLKLTKEEKAALLEYSGYGE